MQDVIAIMDIFFWCAV